MKFTSYPNLLGLIISLTSCTGSHKQSAAIIKYPTAIVAQIASKLKVTDSLSEEACDSVVRSKYLYLKNDSICIATNNKVYRIPKDTTIDYKDAIATIYEIKGDSLRKSYNLVWDGRVYFTTYEDIGIGPRLHLYVFDTLKKTLICDQQFKRNYLYSSGGMFIVDRNANKIFAVEPSMFMKKDKDIIFTSAAMYSISRRNYKYYKSIYELGNKTDEDTLLVKFYHHSLANNGINGKILPNNWWK